MHPIRRWARRTAGGVLVLLLAPAACGDAPEADEMAPEGDAMAGEKIVALNPWVRTAIATEGDYDNEAAPVNTAAYLVLRNPTDAADALVRVETEIADTAEIHTVSMDEGVMRMRPVDSVAIAAGGDAVLEPGGYHIMLIGLRGPVSQGSTVELRLHLRSGEVIDVAAPVLRSPPL